MSGPTLYEDNACSSVFPKQHQTDRPPTPPYASHYAYLPGNDSLSSMCIPSLQSFDWRCRELGAKDDIPESAGHTKAVLIVHEVVLKMVFLQLPPVRWQGSVVQEVMCQVVADITEYSSAKHSCANVPIPVEDLMCELPERYC